MKNIHLIPTDKPSRLHLGNSGLVLCDLVFNPTTINAQHIYITSDEVIKVGDWVIEFQKGDSIGEVFLIDIEYVIANDIQKKIILTTDKDLIADGIQAIDDEFLEWFVNNPSCEYAEVEKENICARCYSNDVNDCWSAKECSDGKFDKIKYKIIIPKEEPKQETLEEVPTELDSVLAKITHQNDLGLSQWYEVVYYDNKWCSYSGSKTFEDGERVVEWKYCKELI